MKKILICLCFSAAVLSANSLRLYNDSPYKLRAVVRGADGSYLGEMLVLPESFNTWTDSYSQFGPLGGHSGTTPGAVRSQTPYTVQWYCLDGSDYSICKNLATASVVLAESCDGARLCKPEPPKQNAGSVEEKLDYDNSVPQNPYLPNSPYNPDNPNSPISPQSPYNPNSPYNPDNPNSPYNPKNPKSPYYKPPQGATGTAQ